jgi:hypothetical protein
MTDLHDAISAALDREQALAEYAATLLAPEQWPHRSEFIAALDPSRTLRRIEADRRVLARHEGDVYDDCSGCAYLVNSRSCPDLLDLAARYDVEVPRD